MKKLDLLTPVCNGLLALLIGLSGIGCMATAIQLQASQSVIVVACLFWAIFPNIVLRIRKGWLITLAAMALWALFFWKRGIVEDAFTLLDRITWIYDKAYHWGQPEFLLRHTGTDSTMALAAIASVCTLLVSLGLASRQSYSVITAAVLPVIPCLVVVDTVPATGWLFVLAVCLVLVLLSQQVRQVDPQRASRVTVFVLIPTVLASWLLFARNPQEAYREDGRSEQFHNRLMQTLDRLPILRVEEGEITLDFADVPTIGTAPDWGAFPGVTGTPGDVTLPSITLDPDIIDLFADQISLGNAGPRNPDNTKVMEVNTKFRGVLYLRERGYDIYTGEAWQRGDKPQTLEMDRRYLEEKNRVAVKTSWVHSSLYVPYFSAVNAQEFPEGRYENVDELRSYSFEPYSLRQGWQSVWRSQSGATIGQIVDHGEYLALPDATRQQADAIVDTLGITHATDVLTAAQSIRAYVVNSATYDLNTPTMPEEYDDFAIWFLTESETGYCVHFATAATVLLRAAGIPARYVEGYMVSVEEDSVRVTSKMAHAWVEYYVPDAGWMVLEATPGNGTGLVPPETEPTTVPTNPTTVSTAPPMVTTEPIGSSTLPTLPTKPTPPTTVMQPTATMPTTAQPTTSAPPATTQPDQNAQPPEDQTDRLALLAVVFGVLGGGCALYGQWQLRLWCKRQRFRRGSTNRQAIAYWRESQKMAALRRQKAPVALRDLAWKAKFSQHTIAPEELRLFEAYLQRSVAHLKKRPWYLRLVYRLIFAAY